MLKKLWKWITCQQTPSGAAVAGAATGSATPPPETEDDEEEKDTRESCPKCRYYRDLSQFDKWSATKFVKDEKGERLLVTCWMCGYEYTEECADAESTNEKS